MAINLKNLRCLIYRPGLNNSQSRKKAEKVLTDGIDFPVNNITEWRRIYIMLKLLDMPKSTINSYNLLTNKK